MGDGIDPMEYGQMDVNAEKKPQFFIKQNGEVVGAAWMRQGQWGKYLSVSINKEIPAGARVLLSPRKGFENLFG